MDGELGAFLRAVLAEPELTSELGAIEDRKAFVERALEAAAVRGLALDAGSLKVALSGAPRDRFLAGAEVAMLIGFAPARIDWTCRLVEWRHLGRIAHDAPVFEQTFERALAYPFSMLVSPWTPVEVLETLGRSASEIPLAGLIFHLSRTGSTVVSRVLGALPEHAVISEPEPFDAVLSSRFSGAGEVSDLARIMWLRGLVNAFGRRRLGSERRLFLKLDAWAAIDLPLIQLAFPSVPWIFVYRNPIDVLASHRKRAGRHMVPGLVPPAVFGFGEKELELPHPLFAVRVLERIMEAVRDALPGSRGLLVEYRELPDAIWGKVAAHFGVAIDREQLAVLGAIAKLDAKSTLGEPFRPDRAREHREADEGASLLPLYEELERLRRA